MQELHQPTQNGMVYSGFKQQQQQEGAILVAAW